jgi:hypothetical protein
MDTVQSTSVNGQHTCYINPEQPCERCKQFQIVLDAAKERLCTLDRSTMRLVRLPDWECDGPYAILAQENNRIIRVGISVSRAVEYLRDLGMREFHIDTALYHAELWAIREGSHHPVGLDERMKPNSWNVLTETEDYR